MNLHNNKYLFNEIILQVENKKMKNKQLYLDRYGGTCARKSLESHLSPLDKDYEGVIKNGKR